MADWKSLVESPPPVGCKFIALYSDGSGSGMFWRHDDGYIDCEGDEREALSDGYSLWTELPEGMTFWCEDSGLTMTLPYIPQETVEQSK